MRTYSTWLLLTLVLALAAVSNARSEEVEPAQAEDVAEPATVPTIDAVTQATPRYQPLVWHKHDAHVKGMKGNCRRCHHDLNGDNKSPGACADCHTAPVADMSLVETYHGLCRSCHLGRKLDGQKHGPVTCLGCHKERE